MSKKKQHTANSVILSLIFLSTVFYAFSSGVTGDTQLNGNGCFCHSAEPSAGVSVVITGPEILAPNETGLFTVNVTGGPLAAAGINIAASAGVLIPGEGLRLAAGELTHNAPVTPSAGVVIFNFSYTAPDTGMPIMYAAANSVNNDGSNTGDQWNFSLPKTITVNPAVNVEDEIIAGSFRLDQNYPNPFNPATIINYEIPADASGELVTLKVYDLLGKEIAQLVNENKSAGSYTAGFNAAALPSGVYIYKITAGNYNAVRKMSLVK
jgi:hypothetical protein